MARYEKKKMSSDDIAEVFRKALYNAPDEDIKTVRTGDEGARDKTIEMIATVRDIIGEVLHNDEAAEIIFRKRAKDDGGGALVQYNGDFSPIMYGIMKILCLVLKGYSDEDADTLVKVLFIGFILLRRFEKDSK